MDAIFSNPHLVIPFFTFVITQSVKMFIKARKGDFQWKYMFSTGDMPSVHSAVATSLVVSLAFVEGVDTAIFAVGAIWALFIIYDSFNVRRAVGEQGGVILKLIELNQAPKRERDLMKFREVLGHTPLEVLTGTLTGLGLGFMLTFRYWPESWQEALGRVGDDERLVYYGVFAAMFIAGIVLSQVYTRGGYGKQPTGKRVRRLFRNGLILPAVVGAIAVWLESEGIRFFSNKVWILSAIAWAIAVVIYGYVKVLRSARLAMAEEAEHFKEIKKKERKKRRRKRKK